MPADLVRQSLNTSARRVLHEVSAVVGRVGVVAREELAERYGVEMPVCQEVYRVLAGEIPASEAYRGLGRHLQAGHEREPG